MEDVIKFIEELVNENEEIKRGIYENICNSHSIAEWEEYYELTESEQKEFIKGTLMSLIYRR